MTIEAIGTAESAEENLVECMKAAMAKGDMDECMHNTLPMVASKAVEGDSAYCGDLPMAGLTDLKEPTKACDASLIENHTPCEA